VYVTLRSKTSGLRIRLELAAVRQTDAVTWLVQALPGSTRGGADVIDLSKGAVTLDATVTSIVATALPRNLANRGSTGRVNLQLLVSAVN
jgi:hypothetical protein